MLQMRSFQIGKCLLSCVGMKMMTYSKIGKRYSEVCQSPLLSRLITIIVMMLTRKATQIPSPAKKQGV